MITILLIMAVSIALLILLFGLGPISIDIAVMVFVIFNVVKIMKKLIKKAKVKKENDQI